MHSDESVTLWEAHAGAGSWPALFTGGEKGAHAEPNELAQLWTLQGTNTGAVCF